MIRQTIILSILALLFLSGNCREKEVIHIPVDETHLKWLVDTSNERMNLISSESISDQFNMGEPFSDYSSYQKEHTNEKLEYYSQVSAPSFLNHEFKISVRISLDNEDNYNHRLKVSLDEIYFSIDLEKMTPLNAGYSGGQQMQGQAFTIQQYDTLNIKGKEYFDAIKLTTPASLTVNSTDCKEMIIAPNVGLLEYTQVNGIVWKRKP